MKKEKNKLEQKKVVSSYNVKVMASEAVALGIFEKAQKDVSNAVRGKLGLPSISGKATSKAVALSSLGLEHDASNTEVWKKISDLKNKSITQKIEEEKEEDTDFSG